MDSVSESVFGQRLRALRESRLLPRSEAERLGGLGAGTLKAWESGSRTPRAPALTRLLDSLEATGRQRAELIALADPLHARVSLEFHAGPPIDLGAVLRAFRLRKGWTQAEAARALGVTQGAVAHWETGERSLEGPALHRALFTLGATGEEVAAALSSPHRPDILEGDPVLVQASINRIPGGLREPVLLASERALWWRAVREPGWDAHLRQAMIHRAVWYAFMRRFDEIEPLWRRIRQMTFDLNADPRPIVVSVVLADVRVRPHASTAGLLRRLENVVSKLDHNSAIRAWARGTQAVALATLGERKSVAIAQQALEEGSRSENPLHEAWHRTVDLAEVHLRLGEPERALETLDGGGQGMDDDLWKKGYAPVGLPVRARALAPLGREPEPELMAALRAHALADGSPLFESRLAGVERDLAAMRKRTSLR